MEVIAAAGSLCSVGCGSAVAAFVAGPALTALGTVAAVGYGIYSLATGDDKNRENFEDAIEGELDNEEEIVPVVKVARQDKLPPGSASKVTTDTSSFL